MTLTSGQLPINPQDGTMPDDIAGTDAPVAGERESHRRSRRPQRWSDRQKPRCLVRKDPGGILPCHNAAYEAFFTEHPGAFSGALTVEVIAGLPKDAGVEIEAIAFAS